MAGYSRIGIHPAKDLEPGRYTLDRTGRLHPIELSRFVKAVCIVTVRARKSVKPTDMSAFVAAMKAKAKPQAKAVEPRTYAQSREPCERCGVPGFRGCSHQLAYQEWSA